MLEKVLNTKKDKRRENKISYKKFTSQIIKCFLLATMSAIFTNSVWSITGSLFYQNEKVEDYASFTPHYLEIEFLNKENFIIFSFLWVFLYFLFTYLYNSWSERLIIKVSEHIKNRLLRKFRVLKLEEKLKRKGEINHLVEIESDVVANIWVNLCRKLYEGTFSLYLLLFSYWKAKNSEREISKETIIFAVFWLIFINGFVYFFNRLGSQYGKLSKEKVDKEYELINKEINNSVLIDGMGLKSKYEKEQLILTRRTKRSKFFYKKILVLSKSVPWELLINLFPLLLLFLILDENFIGANLLITWNILNNCALQFGYLWNYSDYATSQERINNFLFLPEKNDNSTGIKLNKFTKIKALHLQNVTFSYSGSTQPILENYNRTFLKEEINYLTGANGTGKSTILYLLLGMLVPQRGQIIVETEPGITYNLHQDLNLQTWREQNVVYCAHDNLIESGSTGQRQWTNLQNTLSTKSEAQIFLFDEASNALDSKQKQELQGKIEKLVKQKNLVINAKCWKN
ncbi:ATP-binding cassette domain-containing protein [endosymbiont GvMRE of Glomus versiforme]|uniref:ATP-binding cassette domain-containing protein n=1 Tax=endosymbiont GvMRE of Glomus versiforme TaxID=2039283 RepID=UPI000ED6E2B0|nr:ATP-binding cassette domain-containing protein [endosymbiont GvMRE of Glomus versiforme]RHZ35384.1 ABC transporter ATP-binding protein [endosymbiont GvMRE of Glomus versiforme]